MRIEIAFNLGVKSFKFQIVRELPKLGQFRIPTLLNAEVWSHFVFPKMNLDVDPKLMVGPSSKNRLFEKKGPYEN